MPDGAVTEPTINAGTVRALAELAVSKGAREATLLARIGLTSEELSDPDNRIPLATYLLAMRVAKDLCGDPAFALHFGEAIDCSEYSIVGLVCAASDTVADAFAQANRYSRLCVDIDVEQNRFEMVPVEGAFWIVDKRKDPNEAPEISETWVARIATSIRRLTDKHVVKAVHLTHSEPGYRAEYDRILQVPVTFGSHQNAVLFDQSWLTHRIGLTTRYAFGILNTHAEALLRKLESSTTTRGRVESLLMHTLHKGDVGMEEIAGKMGLSRQTLLRKLKVEGTNFDKVLDELRRRLALDYLRGKKVSVNETAYLVGFSDPAAFSRAFKRWTGKSPREVRVSTVH
jgi:AraC-like DNA-binding protein